MINRLESLISRKEEIQKELTEIDKEIKDCKILTNEVLNTFGFTLSVDGMYIQIYIKDFLDRYVELIIHNVYPNKFGLNIFLYTISGNKELIFNKEFEFLNIIEFRDILLKLNLI